MHPLFGNYEEEDSSDESDEKGEEEGDKEEDDMNKHVGFLD